jgi:hypothetical protein
MRRGTVLILLLATGCSTAPVADLMDHFHPSSAPSPVVAAPPGPPGPPPTVRVMAAVPKPPTGALPVAPPPDPLPPPDPPPPAPQAGEPLLQQPIRGGLVPATFRPREVPPDQRKQPSANSRQDASPPVTRSKIETRPVLPDSLPSGLGLPR